MAKAKKDLRTPNAKATADTNPQTRQPFWRQVAAEPVAVGLALILFIRPWRDGITFPGWDAYFLWAALILAALWGARMLLRGESIYHGKPVLLLAAFLLVALATSTDTVQVDSTYRALLAWWCCFLLFFLASNALRTPLSIAIVVCGFFISAFPNAIWAVLHLNYVLTYLRQAIEENPRLLEQLGSGAMGPALEHRLESNRAFGTLLYPNALAAYLLLVLPFALGEIPAALRKWNRACADFATHPDMNRESRLYLSAGVGLFAWFLSEALAFFLYPFLLLLIRGDDNWLGHTGMTIGYLVILPILIAASVIVVTRRSGPGALRAGLQVLLFSGASLASAIALVLSYSRGGMLALVVAMAATAVLLLKARGGSALSGVARNAAAAGLIVASLFSMLNHGAGAQQLEQAVPTPQVDGSIDIEGRDQDLGALADPSSFLIRLTYWRVGWTMAKDNFWTGVGLGNFGTVYAKYKYIGAGATQTAHNAYLKALAETGLFGFIAFCAFWTYFLVYGARVILNATDPIARWQLAGLYCALLAFLGHAFLDFNFCNSALIMPAFALAGLFYARSQSTPTTTSTSKSGLAQIAAIPLLLAVALGLGASMRVFFADLAFVEGAIDEKLMRVGERTQFRPRAEAAQFFLKDMPILPAADGAPVVRDLMQVIPLIPDLARIRDFADIREPVPGDAKNYRLVPPGTLIGDGALIFIRDRADARAAAVEWSEEWIESLALRDELYPHIPDIAATLYDWYDLLQFRENDPEKKRAYIEESLRWAREAARRSPEQSWYHAYVGKALLLNGTVVTGNESIKLYREALASYRHGRDLFPTGDEIWMQYGVAMTKVGNAFIRAGLEEEGRRMVEEGEAAQARALELKILQPLAL